MPTVVARRRALPRWLSVLIAWGAASALAWLWVGVAHGLVIQGRLRALGVDIPLGRALWALVQDVVGLFYPLGLVLALVLGVAFGVAALVRRRAGRLALIGYPVAGWLAVLLAFVAMRLVFGLAAIAAARDPSGLFFLSLGGLVAGILFGLLEARLQRSA